jgi:hypothetical protein
MFLVISFDFENSSTVAIHCLTNDLDKAKRMYRKLCEMPFLVELLAVPDEFEFYNGRELFWTTSRNEQETGCRTILTNNV